LLDGATAVKVFGRYVPVRAEVVGVDELSAHADADDIITWLAGMPTAPSACYVVHGDPVPAAALARRIHTELRWPAVLPRYGERVLL